MVLKSDLIPIIIRKMSLVKSVSRRQYVITPLTEVRKPNILRQI